VGFVVRAKNCLDHSNQRVNYGFAAFHSRLLSALSNTHKRFGGVKLLFRLEGFLKQSQKINAPNRSDFVFRITDYSHVKHNAIVERSGRGFGRSSYFSL
jgi:hypothetical protein